MAYVSYIVYGTYDGEFHPEHASYNQKRANGPRVVDQMEKMLMISGLDLCSLLIVMETLP